MRFVLGRINDVGIIRKHERFFLCLRVVVAIDISNCFEEDTSSLFTILQARMRKVEDVLLFVQLLSCIVSLLSASITLIRFFPFEAID